MANLVLSTVVVAGLSLAVATAYLILLNWNTQLSGTLLSVLLGGTVTLFIAVFTQLREATVSRQFFIDLSFDNRNGLLMQPVPPEFRSEAEILSRCAARS